MVSGTRLSRLPQLLHFLVPRRTRSVCLQYPHRVTGLFFLRATSSVHRFMEPGFLEARRREASRLLLVDFVFGPQSGTPLVRF